VAVKPVPSICTTIAAEGIIAIAFGKANAVLLAPTSLSPMTADFLDSRRELSASTAVNVALKLAPIPRPRDAVLAFMGMLAKSGVCLRPHHMI